MSKKQTDNSVEIQKLLIQYSKILRAFVNQVNSTKLILISYESLCELVKDWRSKVEIKGRPYHR